MREIKLDCTIKADPAKVFKALTEREPMEAWWAECHLVPQEGSDAIFFFRSAGAYKRMKVEKLVPGELVLWRCVDNFHRGKSEWVDTTIRFELKKNATGGTDLHFEHLGWKPTVECIEECTGGWTHFITVSLKNYLETGKGEPFEKSMGQKYAKELATASSR